MHLKKVQKKFKILGNLVEMIPNESGIDQKTNQKRRKKKQCQNNAVQKKVGITFTIRYKNKYHILKKKLQEN